MLASLLIIGFSLVLLLYWFRYSCILLLRDFSDQSVFTAESLDSRFSFASVREQLKTAEDLPALQRALDRDYQVIRYLVDHAAGLDLQSIEDRLLVLDYRLMRLYYRATRTAVPDQARLALSEMASVLGVLAQKIGEQAGMQHQA